MSKFADLAIQIIGYCVFLIGLWFIVNPLIIPSVKKAVQYTRFRSAKNNVSKKSENKLIQHIEMLLHVVLNKNYHGGAQSFIALTVSLFAVTFTLLVKGGQSVLFTILFSLLVSFLPYVGLRVRLIVIRIEGSYEADTLVNEINNQYKICNLNMIEAIDCALPLLKYCKYTQRALFRLSMAIKEYNSEEALDKIIREFVYSVDTDWATRLGVNIKIAVSDGRDVRPSMDDILESLKLVKSTLENEKRSNYEAFSMIRFMVPAVYVLSIFVSVSVFGFTLSKFFDYQFKTDLGLKFAMVVFASMAVDYVVYYLIRKPKYDLE